MINRRRFLQALGAGAVALALPGQRAHAWRADAEICARCGCTALDVEEGLVQTHCTGVARRFFLPARPRITIYQYLTSNTYWFIRTEHQDGLKLFNREPLSEKSLERMLVQISRHCDAFDIPVAIKPARLVVHPSWHGTEELKGYIAKL